MAGSIFVSKQSVHDLRTIDFAWLVEKLRAKNGKTAVVIAKVLWLHDEGGVNMLEADELDETEYKLFAQAIREIYKTSAEDDSCSGMSRFLAMLLQHIESDTRYS